MNKDAFYFPHFCNARHDRKIKRLRKELGVEGYGIFFMLLETLREQTDYRFPVEDIDLLADEFGTSEQKIRAVISNYELFQHDGEEHFFSSNLIMYLQPYFEGKERKRIGGIKGNLIRYGHCTKEDLEGKTPEEIEVLADQFSHGSHTDRLQIAQARKVKERKVNEIKEKEIHSQNDCAYTPQETKAEPKTTYGEFKNVRLSTKEYEKMLDKYGKPFTMDCIEKLSSYKASKGKRYKSDYAAFTTWVIKAVQENQPRDSIKRVEPDIDVSGITYDEE